MRKERHNFFNKHAAHFVDPKWSRLGETKNRLPSSRLESQLFRSEFKSQLTAFLQISKSSATLPGMTSFTSPDPFPIWGFYCDICDCYILPVNTCIQCVHLTNPCTKRKVLSLTKLKGKIFKTKIDNIKMKIKIPLQLYYTDTVITL